MLAFLGIVFLGISCDIIFKRFPFISQVVNLVDQDSLHHKVDLNKATLEELIALPYIGPVTAKRIIDYRQTYGAFHSFEELKNVKGIKTSNFNKFSKFLKVKGGKPQR